MEQILEKPFKEIILSDLSPIAFKEIPGYKEVEGNLITLTLEGNFDVIAHGCNCFCTMGAGIAPQMAQAFDCDKFGAEGPDYKGDIIKLGCIDYKTLNLKVVGPPYEVIEGTEDIIPLTVVNAYTQYHYGKNHIDGSASPIDYEALTLCMRKMNHEFKGAHIGLPQIGAGLAGGDWERIKSIIQKELKDCKVTVVIFKP